MEGDLSIFINKKYIILSLKTQIATKRGKHVQNTTILGAY
jgi:hypothetical protein